jgi:purine-binding chemotaxis protein CheW
VKRAAVDWDLARSRLRSSERALEEALAESPERIAAAYRQRARRLASAQGEPVPLSAGLPALVFRLARERYAIDLAEVSEALPFARCARAPGSPPLFRGLMNLRGELRPVLDLAALLAISENGDRDSGFVLMLRRPGREIGLKVDAIEELRELRPAKLSAPAQGSYVKGIASGALMLLDVEGVLAAVYSKEES